MYLSLLSDIIIIIIIVVVVVIIGINVDDSSCPSVPGKPIITTPGLNTANHGIKLNVIPQIDSVPESMIKTNLGRNCMLNLTHVAGVINSLIGGGKVCQNIQSGGLTVSQICKRKFQQQEVDLNQLTDEEFRSRDRFDRKAIK